MEKLIDGYWYGESSDGLGSCRAVKGDRWAWHREHFDGFSMHWLIDSYWKPLRRIATLDGKPVVDEGVVVAIVGELFGDRASRLGGYWKSDVAHILRKHLDPVKQEQGAEDKPPVPPSSVSQDELDYALKVTVTNLNDRMDYKSVGIVQRLVETAKRLSPPAPDAEGPIVRFEGAFVCWKDGDTWTAWEAVFDNCNYPMKAVRHVDGYSAIFGYDEFSEKFTRTRPIQLSPEHEQLVPLLAKGLNRPESEVRKVLAEVKG